MTRALVLTGDVELSKRLVSLGASGKDGKASFRKGVRAGAKLVAAQLKKDSPRKTGKLIRSIKVRALKRSRSRIGVRVAIDAQAGKGKWPEAGYAYFLEEGTKKHGAKRLRRRSGDARANAAYDALAWRVRPTHFARKGVEDVGGRAIDVAQGVMADEIEKRLGGQR